MTVRLTMCGGCGVALGTGTCSACAAYAAGFPGVTLCGTCGVALGTGKCLYCAMARTAGALPSTTLPPIGGRPPREAPRELPRELAAEPIVAWRSWGADQSGVLQPVGAGSAHPGTWATRDATARCDRCTYLFGTPPGLNCSCGLYASKDNQWRGIVSGKVALYGKVIEHERGYRAQHVRILELHTDPPVLAARLRLNYGVPVTASPPAPPGGVVPPAFQRQVSQRALGGGPFVTTPTKRRRNRQALVATLVSVAFAGFYVGLVLSGTAPAALSVPFALAHAFAAGCYATLYLRPRS